MKQISPINLDRISRRDFIKLSSSSIFAILFPLHKPEPHDANRFSNYDTNVTPILGRVFKDNTQVYKSPSFSDTVIEVLPRDRIINLQDPTIGEQYSLNNSLWYQSESGYIPAKDFQPVGARLHPAHYDLPSSGHLAEISVPYTDAHSVPGSPGKPTYRLYFGATFWINGSTTDKDGETWYSFVDEKWGRIHYANATHFYLYQAEDLTPISPEIPSELKRIEVNLTDQILVAFEDNQPVLLTKVSTGAKYTDGDFSTPKGSFITNRKRSTRHMAYSGPISKNSYDLPGVPWVSYLTKTGVALHGTYWHNDYGRSRSHGCINLSIEAARWLYRWTQPFVPHDIRFLAEDFGTRVDIF